MKINIVSVFPQMFKALTENGVVGQALNKNIGEIQYVNPRDFTSDLHRTVDDRPFGGGDGMILLPEPLSKALESLKQKNDLGHVIYLSPQGQTWSSRAAKGLAQKLVAGQKLTLICGRYGGIDQRIIENYVDDEVSIGDYVLSGGEIAAMVLIDSAYRFIPGVLGNENSAELESFHVGYLEAPLFTRPREFADMPVPEVLLSGHHKKIEEFRRSLGLVRTCLRRPDLISKWPAMELQNAVEEMKKLSDAELKACGLDHKKLKDTHVAIETRSH